MNRPNPQPFETIFIPVSRLPNLTQPIVTVASSPPPQNQPPPATGEGGNRVVTGMAIGMGILGIGVILMVGLWFCGFVGKKKERGKEEQGRIENGVGGGSGVGNWKGKGEMEVDLMADVSDCLDKYRVFKIEELNEATDGFNESFLIQGSVYKGCIHGVEYAIKKMKWNAYEQLKILQKVSISNLFFFFI